MDVIGVAIEVVLIPNQMLPESALPQPPFAPFGAPLPEQDRSFFRGFQAMLGQIRSLVASE